MDRDHAVLFIENTSSRSTALREVESARRVSRGLSKNRDVNLVAVKATGCIEYPRFAVDLNKFRDRGSASRRRRKSVIKATAMNLKSQEAEQAVSSRRRGGCSSSPPAGAGNSPLLNLGAASS